LIDPTLDPPLGLPSSERKFLEQASARHVLTFDNVDRLTGPQTEYLCRFASAGTGQLIVINGSSDLAFRGDFADRCVVIDMPAIGDANRAKEQDLQRHVHKERAKILGVLTSAIAEGLRNLSQVVAVELPRMADFSCWVQACEPALWSAGTFIERYLANRAEVDQQVIEADPLMAAVFQFACEQVEWAGTASDLLVEVGPFLEERVRRDANGRAVSVRVGKLESRLPRHGVRIERDRRGHERQRLIRISRVATAEQAPVETPVTPPSSAVEATSSVEQESSQIASASSAVAPPARTSRMGRWWPAMRRHGAMRLKPTRPAFHSRPHWVRPSPPAADVADGKMGLITPLSDWAESRLRTAARTRKRRRNRAWVRKRRKSKR
jgi:hypothetical protein